MPEGWRSSMCWKAWADTSGPTLWLTPVAVTLSDAPDPIPVGGTVTFTIGIENRGPQDATNVLLRDALPSGMTPLSAVASQGTCTLAETVTCQLGALANGATATATIAVRA